jgi:hypothetical protein
MSAGRDFMGGKKSAQTCIYLIDREKMEWLKVGGNGLMWSISPAHVFGLG